MARIARSALLIGATLYAPFLAKPFHIDDANYVAIAKSIAPSAGAQVNATLFHLGERAEGLHPFASTHPPLVPLVLRSLAALTGGYDEVVLHAGFLVFPFLLLWAAGQFAERLGAVPGAAMLAIGGSVAVLPVGHTLMADLPTAALFTAGAAILDRAFDRRSLALGTGAAVLLLLALAASYQVAFFLPVLLALVPDEQWERRSFRSGLLAVIALVVVVCAVLAVRYWPVLMRFVPGMTQGLRPDWFGNRLLSVPVLLGTALVFLLPAARLPGMSRRVLLSTVAVAVAFAAGVAFVDYPPFGSVVLVVLGWAGIGAMFTVGTLAGTWRGRPVQRFLALWAATALLVALVLLPFGAMRYLIPVVVPASLLLLAGARNPRVAWVAAGLTAGLGLAVAVADYQFAATYRDFAREVRGEIGPAVPGRVWYAGDWGMKYYMGGQGFRYLTAGSDEPRRGDLVILSEVARMWNPSPALGPRMELLEVREIRPPWPLVVLSQRERAGLYSTLWGYYPFVFTTAPLERFGIFRVVR